MTRPLIRPKSWQEEVILRMSLTWNVEIVLCWFLDCNQIDFWWDVWFYHSLNKQDFFIQKALNGEKKMDERFCIFCNCDPICKIFFDPHCHHQFDSVISNCQWNPKNAHIVVHFCSQLNKIYNKSNYLFCQIKWNPFNNDHQHNHFHHIVHWMFHLDLILYVYPSLLTSSFYKFVSNFLSSIFASTLSY